MTEVNGEERENAIRAFHEEKWEEAVERLTKVVAGNILDRECGLMLSSAIFRRGDKRTASAVVGTVELFSQSSLYDSRTAHGTHPDLPYERDLVASFLVENADEIKQRASQALSKAPAPRKRPYAFVYWDTEEQPPLVAAARTYVRRSITDAFELIELNASNINEWVSLTVEMEAAATSAAHRADLIRLELLAQYGGLWVDSTCLLTEGFGGFAAEFMATDYFLFAYAGSRTGNWFWWAESGSYRLQMLRAALTLWLERGGRWTNYFMFHDFVEMLYWTDSDYRVAWDNGVKKHPRNALALLGRINHEISDTEWNQLYAGSPVHKLSWKYNDAADLKPRSVAARVISREEIVYVP